MIHRAILGSVERMIAVLTENFGGKWPFWLSPRQVMVVPVGPTFNEYAANVRDQLKSEGYMCEADLDNSNTMNKKVRNAQLAQYNFIFGKVLTLILAYLCIKKYLFLNYFIFLVVGEKEKENNTVNIRTRDNKVHGERTIEKVKELFSKLAKERTLDSEESMD